MFSALTDLVCDKLQNFNYESLCSNEQTMMEWWKSVKVGILGKDLNESIDTIVSVLQQLNKFTSDMVEESGDTTTPLLRKLAFWKTTPVLLEIFRRAQEDKAIMCKMLLPPLMMAEPNENKDNDDKADSTCSNKGGKCCSK